MSHNPYAPPTAPVGGAEDHLPEGAPTAKLYSPLQIAIATFIGGLIPATLFAAANLRALERKRHAVMSILLGIAGTIAIYFLGLFIQTTQTLFALTLVVTALMFGVARVLFQQSFQRHEAAGGPVHSWWRVVGISVTWGIALGVLSVFLNQILVRAGVLGS